MESPARSNTREFVKKARLKHGYKYKYNKVGTYKNNKTKVNIVCPKHGMFRQRPKDHLRGHGCPLCNEYKLELMTANALSALGIEYQRRIRPQWMHGLELDVFIPSLNVAIECQGIQHFQPVEHFGGEEGYIQRVSHDKMKKEFCQQQNVTLYIITYANKDIDSTIRKIISHHTQTDI